MTDIKTHKGVTKIIHTSCGNLYVTINGDNNQPFEVITRLGKAGGCASAQTETIGRLISLVLKNTEEKERLHETEKIVKQLIGIECHMPNMNCKSCADGTAKVLQDIINECKRKGVLTDAKENNASS